MQPYFSRPRELDEIRLPKKVDVGTILADKMVLLIDIEKLEPETYWLRLLFSLSSRHLYSHSHFQEANSVQKWY